MKILLIAPLCPLPLEKGGAVRIWNIACELSKRYTVDLICFIRKDEEMIYEEELKKVFRKVTFIRRQKMISARALLMRGAGKWSFFRQNLPILMRAAFSLRPLLSVLYESEDLRKMARERDEEGYDFFIAETYYAISALRDELCSLRTPVIMIEQNIEYLLYKRQFQIQRNPIIKLGMWWDVWKMQREEVLFWRRVPYLGGLSLMDNAEIRNVTDRKDILLLENGVNVAWFSQDLSVKRSKKTVLFVGSFSYFTNVDALIWLLDEIWVKVQNRIRNEHSLKDVELHIVGRGADNALKKFVVSKGWKIDDSVEDIRTAFRGASLLIAPLRAGSGTKYKILEAMASSCPVITTDVGAEGLKVSNGTQILVENEVEALADKIVELLKNEGLREQLVIEGFEFVKEYYDWTRVVGRFEQQLEQKGL